MEFNPINRPRIYSEIVDHIRQAIIDGKLRPGEKLPSERDLAQSYGVSRGTIREAMSVLDAAGLVEKKPGSGVFVTEQVSGVLADPFAMMFLLERNSPADLLEVRLILEPSAAALAAERATDEELSAFLKLLHEEEGDFDMPDEMSVEAIESEMDLHYLIARTTKNMVLIKIMNTLAELFRQSFKEYRKRTFIDEKRAVGIRREHREIIRAIVERRPDDAFECMERHLRTASKYF